MKNPRIAAPAPRGPSANERDGLRRPGAEPPPRGPTPPDPEAAERSGLRRPEPERDGLRRPESRRAVARPAVDVAEPLRPAAVSAAFAPVLDVAALRRPAAAHVLLSSRADRTALRRPGSVACVVWTLDDRAGLRRPGGDLPAPEWAGISRQPLRRGRRRPARARLAIAGLAAGASALVAPAASLAAPSGPSVSAAAPRVAAASTSSVSTSASANTRRGGSALASSASATSTSASPASSSTSTASSTSASTTSTGSPTPPGGATGPTGATGPVASRTGPTAASGASGGSVSGRPARSVTATGAGKRAPTPPGTSSRHAVSPHSGGQKLAPPKQAPPGTPAASGGGGSAPGPVSGTAPVISSGPATAPFGLPPTPLAAGARGASAPLSTSVTTAAIDSYRIPLFLLSLYQAAGDEYGIPWQVLAAINEVETDYGFDDAVSSAGAVGWMQFMPATWAGYGVDGVGLTQADPYNPADAIFAAASYLAANGGSTDISGAILAYNHSIAYVQSVLLRATLIESFPATMIDALTELSVGVPPVPMSAAEQAGIENPPLLGSTPAPSATSAAPQVTTNSVLTPDLASSSAAGATAGWTEASGAAPAAGNTSSAATATGAPSAHSSSIAGGSVGDTALLRTARDATVASVRDGTVVAVGRSPLYGTYVTVRDVEGNQFTYSHLASAGTLAGSASSSSTSTAPPPAAPVSVSSAGAAAPLTASAASTQFAASAEATAIVAGSAAPPPLTKSPGAGATSSTGAAAVASTASARFGSGAEASAIVAGSAAPPPLSSARAGASPRAAIDTSATDAVAPVPAVTNALSVLGYVPLSSAPPSSLVRAPSAAPAAGWVALRAGQTVSAGTTIGRVANAGGQGELGFAVQPVGATAPVNPLPFLASWCLRAQVLHPSVPHATKGTSPALDVLGAGATATPAAGNPASDPWAAVLSGSGVPVPGVVRSVIARAGATDLATWGSERMFLLEEGILARDVIADRRITLTSCLPVQVSRDYIDRRLLAVLEYLAASGLDPRVLSASCGDGRPIESLDITAVNGVSLTSGPDASSITALTMERLAALPPGFVPSGRSTAPAGIVVTFAPVTSVSSASATPLASAASAATAPGASLDGGGWVALSARLNLLGNPGLLRNPALGQ